MGKFNQEEENRIIAAQKALSEREKLSVTQAAREFQVDHFKLRRRLKGTKPLTNNGGRNKALNAEQEKGLLAFLDRQIGLDIPLSKDMVVAAAQRILQAAGSKHELGRAWYTRWIKNYPEYYVPTRMGPAPKTTRYI
ncbi:hypothetical protein G7Y89_g14832 [Cudoniella acicularis]|uniref:HTH CENPB-type domain-containing protein n=1 Tax=Cudoniella acicularis TaxID=354080 RepID=A0A8H4QXI5_9HELO|nr:hypothetical protein G7Y89_g14832 [Cudoniella acicularis]